MNPADGGIRRGNAWPTVVARLSAFVAVALAHGVAAQAREPVTVDWVSLEGGCFRMGDDRVYPEEKPVREACVGPFAIMRAEVTNAQFSAFVDATGYVTRAERGWTGEEPDGPGAPVPPGAAVFDPPTTGPLRALNWWRFVEGASWRRPMGADSAAEPPEAHAPVTHVTREDAQAFATWVGGRLPTEAEWEYAARGGVDGALYAWEEAEAKARAQANTWQGVFPHYNTNKDGYSGLAPVAQFPANGFGLYDMIGNAWEWTATPYAADHTDRARQHAGVRGLDPSQPGAAVGVIRGGSYLCAASFCFRFRPAARQAQDLAFGTSHIGFRVVKD